MHNRFENLDRISNPKDDESEDDIVNARERPADERDWWNNLNDEMSDARDYDGNGEEDDDLEHYGINENDPFASPPNESDGDPESLLNEFDEDEVGVQDRGGQDGYDLPMDEDA